MHKARQTKKLSVAAIADRTAYDVRYTGKPSNKPFSVKKWQTAGTHDPIQRVEFMNALNPL